jgi:hypothetical protein
MARVGRLAGAILAETGGDYYLVGNPKQPCDWRAAGFEPPIEIDAVDAVDARDARVRPVVRLARCGAPALAAPVLELDVEGEPLTRLLVDAFVIARTGSVSERLWRLVIGQSADASDADDAAARGADHADDPHRPAVIAARWLGEMPPAVWRIVRDTVLRCT